MWLVTVRIAFLTSEYPSEVPNRGGLATYVHRMCHLLRERGHEPEVFVSSQHNDAIEFDGVRVSRVNWRDSPDPRFRAWQSLAWRVKLPRLVAGANWLVQAYSLAQTLERRHEEAPFALVQSADYEAVGLFVRCRQARIHAIRCSGSADLYDNADGSFSRLSKLRGRLERAAMRRAHVVYAPSNLLSRHFKTQFGLDVGVIRPPLGPFAKPARPSFDLPSRFLLHFGQLMRSKGTALIAKALPLAWREEPGITMVWSGVCWSESQMNAWRRHLGHNADKVIYTGPLERAIMTYVLQAAEASVLPSEVDNLPNTVIESLAHGIPVVGTRGSSIDELIDNPRFGYLIDIGDEIGLARAMIDLWRRTSPVKKGFQFESRVAGEMVPETAIRKFLALADRR